MIAGRVGHRHLSRRRFARLWVLMCGLAVMIWGCQEASPPAPLEKILKANQITVITENNPYCFYLYRDQPMGFEYELAKTFADYLGVRLKVKVVDSWDAMIAALNNGEGDFIAASIAPTYKRRQQVAFSEGYLKIRQRIIVHRNNVQVNWIEDLAGHEVHVRKGSAYQERLEELQHEGVKLTLKLHTETPEEMLIRQIVEGKIAVTVADSHIARLNQIYYPQIFIGGPVASEQSLAWATKPEAEILREHINRFFKTIANNGQFDEIHARYYPEMDEFDYVDLRAYHRRLKTRLPKYKEIIRAAADDHGFDWRLIAAQMYQESHFNSRARSHAGAYGLMQLTRRTARSLGVKKIYNPTQNIRAGVKHLKYLYDYFDEATGDDRLFLSLAAYNIGQGHLNDARRLAREMDLDPNKWSSLLKTLPLLSYKNYYAKTEYGYARGTEPIEYLKQIMIYYDILKRQGIEYKNVDYYEKNPWQFSGL